jgi:nicotinamidase-related amidase
VTKSALLLIDIQNGYFPDGAMALAAMPEAADKASGLLKAFRAAGRPVVHVRHLSVEDGATFFLPETPGCDIHSSVMLESGEAVIEKNYPSGSRDTELDWVLRTGEISRLVIAGSMSYMCIDATTWVAVDAGFDCFVVHDTCATPDLEFEGVAVPAAAAHAAFMAGLADGYASVIAADAIEQQLASAEHE